MPWRLIRRTLLSSGILFAIAESGWFWGGQVVLLWAKALNCLMRPNNQPAELQIRSCKLPSVRFLFPIAFLSYCEIFFQAKRKIMTDCKTFCLAMIIQFSHIIFCYTKCSVLTSYTALSVLQLNSPHQLFPLPSSADFSPLFIKLLFINSAEQLPPSWPFH